MRRVGRCGSSSLVGVKQDSRFNDAVGETESRAVRERRGVVARGSRREKEKGYERRGKKAAE